MKILLAQINPIVGALKSNAELIRGIMEKKSGEADILVFPEMCLTGYPPQDLLFESHFIDEAHLRLTELSRAAGSSPVIVGTVRKENDRLFNTAAVLQNGHILGFRDKSLLPTYDVFDEDRYFAPAETVEILPVDVNGRTLNLGLEICEDLWDMEYDLKVTRQLAQQGADIIINISASPFSTGRLQDRLQLVKTKTAESGVPFVYCNLTGAQDELVFDGRSFVMSGDSHLITMCKGFEDDLTTVDLADPSMHTPDILPEPEEIFQALTLGVKDYFRKTGHSLAVIGLSGGIDSALVAAVAAAALGPEQVLGVTMPSRFSSGHSVSDSEQLARNLGIQFLEIPIRDLNETMLQAVEPVFAGTEFGIAEENIQARLRGNILMAIANKQNALVLNTGNKTETALGYCTMYGDMCGALAVISDLNKVQVYDVCRQVNEKAGRDVIPDHTLTKAPSAELRPEQVDPFDYAEVSPLVDEIVTENKALNGLVKDGYDEMTARRMLRLVRLSEYKRRQAAPGIRISPKAFGIGRRYPIVNHFTD